jgi:hypothetical protein
MAYYHGKPRNKKKLLAFGDLWVKGVPREVLVTFKAYCALRGMTVKEAVIALLREKVKDTALRPFFKENPHDEHA